MFVMRSIRQKGKGMIRLARAGQRFVSPLVLAASHMRKASGGILRFYIDRNNRMVAAEAKRYPPKDILILLPHCLQYSECGIRVTGAAANCRRCMRCKIGGVLALADKHDVGGVRVVSGGTSARQAAADANPALIIAVACERDLSSGIADTRGTPVVGIVNVCPNGPCRNTDVDLAAVEAALETHILNGGFLCEPDAGQQ